MDLSNHVKVLCQYVIKYKNKFNTMSAHEFAGFKRNHANTYNFLRNTLQNDIFIHNLNTSLATLFCKVDKEKIDNDSFNMLTILVNSNPNFGNKGILGAVPIEKLKLLKTSIESQFTTSLNDIDIQSPSFNTNESENSINANQHAANQALLEKISKKIKEIYKRIHKKENNIKVAEYHIKNGSAPKQLFIDSFPQPFLIHDIIFVQEYDKLVKTWQVDALKLSISCMKRQIENLKNNINNLKDQITPQMHNDVDDLLCQLSEEAYSTLESTLQNAFEKAERVNIRTFFARDKSPEEKDDDVFNKSFESRRQNNENSENGPSNSLINKNNNNQRTNNEHISRYNSNNARQRNNSAQRNFQHKSNQRNRSAQQRFLCQRSFSHQRNSSRQNVYPRELNNYQYSSNNYHRNQYYNHNQNPNLNYHNNSNYDSYYNQNNNRAMNNRNFHYIQNPNNRR